MTEEPPPPTVLLSDRSHLTRFALRRLLDDMGAEIIEHDHGAEPIGASLSTSGTADVVVVMVGDEFGNGIVQQLAVEHASLPIVAIVADESPDAGASIVRAGATTLLYSRFAPLHLADAIRSAREGIGLVPTAVLRWLSDHDKPTEFLSADEIEWVRDLASGITVAELSTIAGYSERSMYRLLHGLYGRLGVSSRHEAVDCARRRNLI